eukprot:1681476-Pyramimonas_sp.AAC.1
MYSGPPLPPNASLRNDALAEDFLERSHSYPPVPASPSNLPPPSSVPHIHPPPPSSSPPLHPPPITFLPPPLALPSPASSFLPP